MERSLLSEKKTEKRKNDEKMKAVSFRVGKVKGTGRALLGGMKNMENRGWE